VELCFAAGAGAFLVLAADDLARTLFLRPWDFLVLEVVLSLEGMRLNMEKFILAYAREPRCQTTDMGSLARNACSSKRESLQGGKFVSIFCSRFSTIQ
jgi:hypothetical protein